MGRTAGAASGNANTFSVTPILLDPVDIRLIRIIDVLVLVKRVEGDFDALTTLHLDPDQVGDLGVLAGTSSGLSSDEDGRKRRR